MQQCDRKRISDRILVEIILKHKDKIIDSVRMQDDINRIIDEFTAKTGREIEQIEVEEKEGRYKLKLRVQ